MRLVVQRNEELVQLATRIPRRVARRLKEFCVRNDVRMQSFVRTALAEKLARARASCAWVSHARVSHTVVTQDLVACTDLRNLLFNDNYAPTYRVRCDRCKG